MAGLIERWFGPRRDESETPTGRVEPALVRNTLTDYPDLKQALESMEFGIAGLSAAGVPVTVATASRIVTVGNCIRVLANDVATLPLVLYRRDGEDKNEDRDNPVYSVLKKRPNEHHTAALFRKVMQRDLLTRGVAYALLSRNLRGQVDEMWRMHPDRVRPVLSEDGRTVTFEYTRPDGRRATLDRDQVLWILGDTEDGLKPRSPIQVHRDTFGEAIAMQEHSSGLYRNGAKLSGVLSIDASMGDAARKALREDFDRLYTSSANAGKTAVLDRHAKFEPIAISNRDAQYIENKKLSQTDICGIFGVPPHKIGILDRATFSNIEHQGLQYLQDGFMPQAVAWEQAVDRDVLRADPAYFVKFRTAALLRGDAKSRSEALNIQRRAGVITANQWRDLEDMNRRKDPAGDTYIIESNMQADDGTFQGNNGGTNGQNTSRTDPEQD